MLLLFLRLTLWADGGKWQQGERVSDFLITLCYMYPVLVDLQKNLSPKSYGPRPGTNKG